MARLFLAALLAPAALAYHDCVQPKAREWPYDARVTAPAMRSLFRRPGAGEAAGSGRGESARFCPVCMKAAQLSNRPAIGELRSRPGCLSVGRGSRRSCNGEEGVVVVVVVGWGGSVGVKAVSSLL